VVTRFALLKDVTKEPSLVESARLTVEELVVNMKIAPKLQSHMVYAGLMEGVRYIYIY
jgi:hypothetical protein